jgi:hypothetical protein
MIPLKFKMVITGLQLLLKEISSTNVSKVNIPKTHLHFTKKVGEF